LNPGDWSFALDDASDDEANDVTITASFGAAGPFVKYDSDCNCLRISDLSSGLVLEGTYTLTITLDDGTVTTTYTIVLKVLPPPDSTASAPASPGSVSEEEKKEELKIASSVDSFRSNFVNA